MEKKDEMIASILQHWRSLTILRENLPLWRKIFALSCAVAVSFDPLFFYVLIVNDDTKCVKLDKKLKIVTLVVRFFTDLLYIADMMHQIITTRREKVSNALEGVPRKAKRIRWPYILIDILAVLPFPQVFVLVFLTKTVTSRSPNGWKFFIISLMIFQYVPRVLRIYLPWNRLDTEAAIWVKVAFSLFQVMLASHFLGAFWYFMAIQREIDCWRYACQNITNGCDDANFVCGYGTFINTTLINDLCPINSPNAVVFDFGIYIRALQFGTDAMGSSGFAQKFLYCFWWGLQNLSSLGQNLQPSAHASENLTAIATFCLGLVLFIVFVDDFTQIRDRLKAERRKKRTGMRERKYSEIQTWLVENGLPKSIKPVIMQCILSKENKDVNLKNILSIIPSAFASRIKCVLCLPKLQQVPVLQCMNELGLKAICKKLEPVTYTEGRNIMHKGEPLQMLIIMQGKAESYTSTASTSTARVDAKFDVKKGDLYGKELVDWALKAPFSSKVPTSTGVLRSLTEVEAFVLKAKDLKSILPKLWWLYGQMNNLTDAQVLSIKNWAASFIQAAWRDFRRRQAVKRQAGYPRIFEENYVYTSCDDIL